MDKQISEIEIFAYIIFVNSNWFWRTLKEISIRSHRPTKAEAINRPTKVHHRNSSNFRKLNMSRNELMTKSLPEIFIQIVIISPL